MWEFFKLRFHKQVLKESLMDTSWEMWLKLALSPVGSPALRKRQGSLNLGKMEKKRERERKERKEGKGRKGEMKREKKNSEYME